MKSNEMINKLPEEWQEELDNIEKQLSHNYPAVVSRVADSFEKLYNKECNCITEASSQRFSIIEDVDGHMRLQSPLSIIKISDIKYIEVRESSIFDGSRKSIVAVLNRNYYLTTPDEDDEVIRLIKLDAETSTFEIEVMIEEIARLLGNEKYQNR